MSLFDDYVAALQVLGGAIVNAAQGALASSDQKSAAAYNAAQVDLQVARAVAAYAAQQTGEAAKKALDAAQHMVETAHTNISAGVAAVEQNVTDSFKSAADIAAEALGKAAKGTHDALVKDVETFAVIGLVAAVGLYFVWRETQKSESVSEMRRFILAHPEVVG